MTVVSTIVSFVHTIAVIIGYSVLIIVLFIAFIWLLASIDNNIYNKKMADLNERKRREHKRQRSS